MDRSTIACPSCRRHVFTRNDVVYAPLDGTARCRACGRTARLDLFSRWMLSCTIAVTLPGLLLYWNVFYSGHLFVISMFIILVAWRLLLYLSFPVLALEPVPGKSPVDHRSSALILAVLLAAAMMIDTFMASRFETDDAVENRHVTSSRMR